HGTEGLARLLPVRDLARVDTRAARAHFARDARFRWGRVLDWMRYLHRIEPLLHAGHVLRMRDDEEIVVDHAVQHALARFERIHSRGWPGAARYAGRWRVGFAERVFHAGANVVVRVDPAWTERGRAHGRAFQLDAERLYQSDDTDFCRRVHAQWTARKQSAHRRRDHDVRALAMLQHVRQACDDCVERGCEVHGERVIPILQRDAADGCPRLDASIVDDEMQTAELAFDLLEHLRPALAVGDVVPDRQNARVPLLEERQR